MKIKDYLNQGLDIHAAVEAYDRADESDIPLPENATAWLEATLQEEK